MKMFKLAVAIIILLGPMHKVWGQQGKPYPFQMLKSGHGVRSVIFLPAQACSGEVWKGTCERYESEYTCYTLTVAGIAGVPPVENPTFNMIVTGVAAYIKDNNIEKPILVGHGMGGGVAMALAADHPDLVGKIVVVDAMPFLDGVLNPPFKTDGKRDCALLITLLSSLNDHQFYMKQRGWFPCLLIPVCWRLWWVGV